MSAKKKRWMGGRNLPGEAGRTMAPSWLLLAFMALLMGLTVLPVVSEGGDPIIQEGNAVSDRGKMTSVLLEEANEAYQKGEYQRAIDVYQLILGRGIRNGYLYFNIGNGYQRKGQTGLAIQNYLIAQRYLPRDGNVEANLNYARALTRDRIEAGEPPWIRRVLFWYDRTSDFELICATLGFSFLFWLLLALRWLRRGWGLQWAIVLSGLVAMGSGGTAVHRAWSSANSPLAVVLGEEISVRSGTDVNSVRLFVLHEGTEVRTEEHSGDWLRIELSDGKRGWVESRFLGLVRH